MSDLNEQLPTTEGSVQEKMIDAVKITAVFSDEKVLERIGDRLLSQGLISGFHVDRIHGGYIYGGKKVEEAQFSLEIVLETTTADDLKAKIVGTISAEIKHYWDVPIIEEERIRINENLLHFIRRAEVEHGKFEREKSLRKVLSLAVLVSMSTAVATLSEMYARKREQGAVAGEIKKAHAKIEILEHKIEQQIKAMEHTIETGGKFTPASNDMAADQGYVEPEAILQTVREVEFEMRKLSEKRE